MGRPKGSKNKSDVVKLAKTPVTPMGIKRMAEAQENLERTNSDVIEFLHKAISRRSEEVTSLINTRFNQYFTSIEQMINTRFNDLEDSVRNQIDEAVDKLTNMNRVTTPAVTVEAKATPSTKPVLVASNGVDNSDDILDMFS